MTSPGTEPVSLETKLVAAEEFRLACAQFPTGVTVVTRSLANGTPYGLTVSAFTPVSLEPPLVLVCIDHHAAFLEALAPHEVFAVNVLNENQRELSVRFAQRGVDRFAETRWVQGWRGLPILPESVAVFECELEQNVAAGDHKILIGRVRNIARGPGQPLLYYRSDFHKFLTPESKNAEE